MLLLLFVGLDREGSIIAALVALILAALTVSVGAWVLLARERRSGRRNAPPAGAPTEVLPATPPSRLHD
jgi:hypothetical protein